MSPNRRILLNIVATYGRSLYALVCGLFISRWVLAALGKTDFGLYGVVGGMMVIELLAGTMRPERDGIAGELLKKANSEVASLQGRPRIGELAFDGEYGNRFRQILQGVG